MTHVWPIRRGQETGFLGLSLYYHVRFHFFSFLFFFLVPFPVAENFQSAGAVGGYIPPSLESQEELLQNYKLFTEERKSREVGFPVGKLMMLYVFKFFKVFMKEYSSFGVFINPY